MPTISFKVTAQEAARIRQLARREHRTLSEFLRRRAMGAPATRAGGEYRIEVSATTGLPVMRAPEDLPPVTSEQIRALLVDFP